MKSVLGIAVLLTWFARCDEHGVDFPNPHHRPDAGQAGPGNDEDAGADAIPDCSPTELYKPHACERPGSPCFGLRKYSPKYELWSDGADKERFIYLPPDTQIDTTQPDTWVFPRGTKIYKTFSLDGKRIETRIMTKTGDATGTAAWSFAVYAWNAAQTEATQLVGSDFMAGMKSPIRPGWDIPSENACKRCHAGAQTDAVNGFSAIQLNHWQTDPSLRDLLAEGRLTNTQTPRITLANARLPGDAVTQDGLGYLHANCGHCHSKGTSNKLELWSKTNTPVLCDQPTFNTAVGVNLCRWTGRPIPGGARRVWLPPPAGRV